MLDEKFYYDVTNVKGQIHNQWSKFTLRAIHEIILILRMIQNHLKILIAFEVMAIC